VRTAVDRCRGSSESHGEVTLAVALLDGSYRIRTTFHSVRTFIAAQRADDPVLRRWLGLLRATSGLAERSGFTSHPVALKRVCGLVREVEHRRRAGNLATGRVGDETLALAGVDVAMLNRGSAAAQKLERMRPVLEPRFLAAGLSADSAQRLVTFN
jgi:hypothetical protein